MNHVLNTGFYLPFGFRGVTRTEAEAAFIQDLVCYDTVWILTDQMAAIPKLIEIMGLGAFEQAIEQGVIKFVHDRHILGWPQIPGYSGLVPVDALASIGPAGANGFSQIPTREMVDRYLGVYGTGGQFRRALSNKVEEVSIDFGGQPSDLPIKTADEAIEGLLRRLALYEEVVAKVPNFPITRGDLIRLRKEIRSGKRPALRGDREGRYKVATVRAHTGPTSLEEQPIIPRKQLALVNLALSDRFLAVHARLMNESATLHTEPVVENVLTARAAAARAAAGNELSVLLDDARVYLPVLATPETFPYSELLKARLSPSAVAFRSLVKRRDSISDARLVQEYIASLHHPLEQRLVVKAARFILALFMGPPALSGLLDTFALGYVFEHGKASFFIDEKLRRLTGNRR